MAKIVAGPAISPGGAAESPRMGGAATGASGREGVPCLNCGR
jgi:hypothetical protein